MSDRQAARRRWTNETDVRVQLKLDGKGRCDIEAGIGFFDHMLTQFAVQGLFDLHVRVDGDRQVDDHHAVEDVGIVLGEVVSEAIGERARIARYGSSIIPMDEALALAAIDLSGRAACWLEAELSGKIGSFDAELVEEFFTGFSRGGALTLHARILAGRNRHHMAEALFKALGRALDAATQIDPRREDVPSSKGTLGR